MENYGFLKTKSETLKEIIKYRKGYRAGESLFNKNLVVDMVKFEYIELGNDSVRPYCEEQYNIKGANFEDFIMSLETYLGDKIYGIWLTSYGGVLKHYYREGFYIEEHQIPEDAIFLDDMGSEGVLIATSSHPSTWNIQ